MLNLSKTLAKMADTSLNIDISNPANKLVLLNLEKLVHLWKLNDEMELEMKHCYIRSKNDFGSTIFSNGTTLKNAEFIRKIINLEKNYPNNSYSETVSTDSIYNEGKKEEKRNKENNIFSPKFSYRRSEIADGKEVIIKKVKLQNVDVNYWFDGYHFSNIRFSLCREVPLKEIPKNANQTITRTKNRISLEQEKMYRYELTKVDGNSKSFEFEVELVKSPKTVEMTSRELARNLLQIVPRTFERFPRVRAVFSLAKHNRFIMESVYLLIKRHHKKDAYNLFSKVSDDSKKLVPVVEYGIQLEQNYKDAIGSNNKAVGKFYYNILNGKWEMIGLVGDNTKITLLSDLFSLMERRVGL